MRLPAKEIGDLALLGDVLVAECGLVLDLNPIAKANFNRLRAENPERAKEIMAHVGVAMANVRWLACRPIISVSKPHGA